MPITTETTINLNPLERAAIDALKAEGTTAEEYIETNSVTQERLDSIVKNFVASETAGEFYPVGAGIVTAKYNDPSKLIEIQPHVDAIKGILGLT